MSASRRFTLIEHEPEIHLDNFAEDVRRGLQSRPKSLPCRYFYDEIGSQLFEMICETPEYYLTRAEREILETQSEEISRRLEDQLTVVELGSGSSVKTRVILEALLEARSDLRYVPIDISPTMLEESAEELLDDYGNLEVCGIVGEYEESLRKLDQVGERRPRLVLWLGSSLGNYERDEASRFLRRLRAQLGSRDRVLVGIDLRKDPETLERAYDDSSGVTAAFNKNILARINRELGGEFDLDQFRHRAPYNVEKGRMEIYLESARHQTVPIRELDLEVPLEAGERIHTENSYKYSLQEIETLGHDSGLSVEDRWFDSERRFSLNLFAPVD